MASSKVKCKICGASFDRNIDPYIKLGTRYCHKECYEKYSEETSQLRKLTDFIKDLYKPYSPDWKMIGTQIQKFKEEGMTYYGMLYTLEYFFVVKKNKIDKNHGIGIIPSQYKKAQTYYSDMNNIYAKTASIKNSDTVINKSKEEIVEIPAIKREKKLIDFEY